VNLKQKTVRAILWASSAKIISQAFSWIVTIILARLLLPSDFGIIAMAWLYIAFLDLITELGVGAAIIQKKDLDSLDLHTCFWFSLFMGVFFYLPTYMVAPAIATFFKQIELTNIIRLLGLIFIIASIKTIPYNLLTKELDFNKRSIAEVLSIISGGVLSVILAFLGYGVWSLVYGALLRYFVLTIASYYMLPWRPKLIFSLNRLKSLMNFGIVVVGSRMLRYFHNRSDILIIGKVLGDKSLGYYQMALQIATLPVEKITAIINQVALPTFSKLQRNNEELRSYFLKITKAVSLITFPIIAGIIVTSESLIKVVLTEKWISIEIPMQFMCLVGLIKSVDQIIPMILLAKGKPNLFFRFNLICAIILPITMIVVSSYGINAIAAAFAIVYPFLSLILWTYGFREIKLSISDYVRNLFPSIIGSIAMTVGVMLFQVTYRSISDYGDLTMLVGSIGVGVICYFIFLKFYFNNIFSDIYDIYKSFKRQEVAPE